MRCPCGRADVDPGRDRCDECVLEQEDHASDAWLDQELLKAIAVVDRESRVSPRTR